MNGGSRLFATACAAVAGFALSFSLVAAAWQGPAGGAGRGFGGGAQGGGGRGAQPTDSGQGRGPAARGGGQSIATGTGTIAGTITLQGAGSPVRRAQVTLSGTELRGQRSATTNDQGRFSFVALPAGRFNLNVTKPGYVTIAFGAKKPGRQGTPIQLADGQTIDDANIVLPKGSVITGTVIDEHGEPSPNTMVRAYRYSIQNGQKSLVSAGQNQTDDRGIYRIFQLQPGDYLVSAVPRNQGNDVRQQLQSQLEPLLQQLQAQGGLAALAGRAGQGGAAGGGPGQQLFDQVQQLQQQLQQPGDQPVAYAPVYFPGTTTASAATKLAVGVGEERSGVDFQLQLVGTAKVQGTVVSPDGSIPQGAQISLQMAGQQDAPNVPGVGMNMARIGGDGSFQFQSVTPGQYVLSVRAPIRQSSPGDAPDSQAARGAAGRGGRAATFGAAGRGPGAIVQLLWASADVTIDGRDVTGLTLTLQPGMTVSGRVAFDASSSQPPADLTRVRVNLQPIGQSETGPPSSAQVDASGSFTISGVAPGRYFLRGNIGAAMPTDDPAAAAAAGRAFGASTQTQGGGSWTLKSVMVDGRDTLDFPLEIRPNDSVPGAVLMFTDKTQQLTGTLQDAMGRPTADYTIILFAADNQFWTPQSRRILSSRPGTDGKFTFRNMPPGQYRLTAVSDAEPGEWYDPAFLSQVVPASMTLSIADGETKTQDIRLAGGPSQ